MLFKIAKHYYDNIVFFFFPADRSLSFVGLFVLVVSFVSVILCYRNGIVLGEKRRNYYVKTELPFKCQGKKQKKKKND